MRSQYDLIRMPTPYQCNLVWLVPCFVACFTYLLYTVAGCMLCFSACVVVCSVNYLLSCFVACCIICFSLFTCYIACFMPMPCFCTCFMDGFRVCLVACPVCPVFLLAFYVTLLLGIWIYLSLNLATPQPPPSPRTNPAAGAPTRTHERTSAINWFIKLMQKTLG